MWSYELGMLPEYPRLDENLGQIKFVNFFAGLFLLSLRNLG